MDCVSRPARRSEGDPRDADLLRLIRAGEPGAIVQLYQRLGRPAFALARRLLADDTGAEEVVRAAFLSVWRDPESVSAAGSSVAAAVLALVHQHAVAAIREGSALRRPPSRHDPAQQPVAPARRHAAEPSGGDLVERVRLAAALLPTAQRETLVLAYHAGYTQREVAALTGVPLSTVKSRM